MFKYNQIFGVDISKDVFDVMSSQGKHFKFKNSSKGFNQLTKHLTKKDLIVMEATGYYHYCLAKYLYDLGYTVSVVNPLAVKRFVQMKLSKIKTDKSDALAICQYASLNEVPIFTSKDSNQAECVQLMSLIEIYLKQRTALKNKLHGEKILGKPSKTVYHSINRSLKVLQKEIQLLENRLLELVKSHQQKQLTLLKSIPGMGTKTAIILIVLTDGFTKFENAKQLCSYAGTTPTIRMSGSSVRGKSRISKMGNQKLRNLLFLCAFSACKYNKACRELYERIVAKGKSKKLALIAVINKLLKQAFAVAKSGLSYDENYVSNLS
ncbi:IS110 family RNA-guided transposase [Eudoraea adriatica]|uniref:IS110 family transposase n=3 Tax=Eudoraea adriatica TaxID=446681 RepID=UPI000378FB30|nr:IS110 family transposase [Eudoraea adriatica]